MLASHTPYRYVVCVRGIGLRLVYGSDSIDMSANIEKILLLQISNIIIFASLTGIGDAFDMVEFSRYVTRPYAISIHR